MSTDLTNYWINKSWDNNPSYRTVLYFAFLLTRSANSDQALIRDELKKKVSLQEAEFDTIVQDLVFYHIMTSAVSCALTHVAIAEMEHLLERDLGSTDPVPFDGVEICDAESKTRNRLWVHAGSEYLYSLFNDIPGLTIISRDHDRFRRILTFEWTSDTPVLIICFVNTDRMTKMSEFEPLRTYAEGAHFSRLQRAQGGENVTLDGLKTISIMAAPTYSTAVASAALVHPVPTRLIGPINLAHIGHFLERHPQNREIHYRAMLEFLDPIGGGLRSGIVFAPPLIEYMKSRSTNWQD